MYSHQNALPELYRQAKLREIPSRSAITIAKSTPRPYNRSRKSALSSARIGCLSVLLRRIQFWSGLLWTLNRPRCAAIRGATTVGNTNFVFTIPNGPSAISSAVHIPISEESTAISCPAFLPDLDGWHAKKTEMRGFVVQSSNRVGSPWCWAKKSQSHSLFIWALLTNGAATRLNSLKSCNSRLASYRSFRPTVGRRAQLSQCPRYSHRGARWRVTNFIKSSHLARLARTSRIITAMLPPQ